MAFVGELYKHTNEDEEYYYKVLSLERNLVQLINLRTNHVFFEDRILFGVYYQGKTVRSLEEVGMGQGDIAVCFENNERFTCDDAWMCDLYEMAYSITNHLTGNRKSIFNDELKQYYRVPLPGTYVESRIHENCTRLIAHLEVYVSSNSIFHFSMWEEQLRALVKYFDYSTIASRDKRQMAEITKKLGLHLRSGAKSSRFIKTTFCELSMHFLCD